MKHQTIRFYTDTGIYMGWAYLNSTNYYNKVRGWIRSGNTVMVRLAPGQDRVITWINRNIFWINKELAACINQ